MSKKVKNKKAHHVTYNKKMFLAPDSILSMAAIHTKIKKNGECSIKISDCNNSIKLWNDLNDTNQVKEMLTKISNLERLLKELRTEVEIKLSFNAK